MARNKQPIATKKAKLIAEQAVALADYAAKALVAAEQLRIKTKAVEHFPLDADERAAVAELPALASKLKTKLAKEGGSFTVAEVASLVQAAESFVDAEPQQVALLVVTRKLMDCLQQTVAVPSPPAKATKARVADTACATNLSGLPGVIAKWQPTGGKRWQPFLTWLGCWV